MALTNFFQYQKDFSNRVDPGYIAPDYLQELADIRSSANFGGGYIPVWKRQPIIAEGVSVGPGGVNQSPGEVATPDPNAPWRSQLSPDEAWIIQRESGFRPDAFNKTPVRLNGRDEHAFGLGQLIDSNRRSAAAALGISNPNTTDPYEQLAMFRWYVANRYGNAAEARRRYQIGKGY